MENEIFDEVEHWLCFIKNWELENDDSIPDEVFTALEQALEKAISNYKDRNSDFFYGKYFH